MYHDYESFWMGPRPALQFPMLEAYRGVDVVKWWGQIENTLIDNIEKYVAVRNKEYVDKLEAFLRVWREHKIDGSINRETLDALESATEVLAVSDWDLDKYFRSIRDNLRVLIASEEELPRIDAQGAGGARPGGMGMSKGGKPPPVEPGPTSEFGPDKEGPGDQTQNPDLQSPDNAQNAVDLAVNKNKVKAV